MRRQPTLETARLRLRPFRMADADDVQRLAGDRAVADTTLNIPHPYEDGFAEQWIGNHRDWFERGQQAVFAVILKASPAGASEPRHLSAAKLIGAVGLLIDRGRPAGRARLLDRQAVLEPGLLHRGGPGRDWLRVSSSWA